MKSNSPQETDFEVPLPSVSGERGVSLLQKEDLAVYSAGISTAGFAEIRMAQGLPQRTITATTIDQKGAEYTRQLIKETGLTDQISIKIEDLRRPLPYKKHTFDLIYARLVLHYLSKKDLDNALKELYRILKPGKRIFIVVRSARCPARDLPGADYEPKTGFTTIHSKERVYARYFHTETSLKQHLEKAGFSLFSMDSYKETLCVDYKRKQLSDTASSLLEAVAIKP